MLKLIQNGNSERREALDILALENREVAKVAEAEVSYK